MARVTNLEDGSMKIDFADEKKEPFTAVIHFTDGRMQIIEDVIDYTITGDNGIGVLAVQKENHNIIFNFDKVKDVGRYEDF